ncbi:hypothetical protein LWI28_024694 [Acer negundo]|uniref:Zinc finger PMZ-type domain-containing protein n=1 Tax=Acer negundo TaxID=4023 RepID=A0AAD5J1H9_ACENE|nr:hypothetical protein LWI28_024694 [Acer negundo]
MGVNDSVPPLDSSGGRSKYNAKVVQSESKHCTNYNVDCKNVHIVEDDAIDCGTHCRVSSVPSNEQETHRRPLQPHQSHVVDRVVHLLPVHNTTNISLSCITNNVLDADRDNTTYVHTPPDHNPFKHKVQGFDHVSFENITACNQRYYNNAMEIGVDKFTRAYSPKNRYGMMSTQISESLNSVLLDLRKLPIADLIEQIKDMMQNWFHNRRTIANRLRSDLTSAADNHILKGVEPSYKCIIHPISYHRYNVTENQNNSIVDIQVKTCGCHEWDLEKLPYKHALTCARYVIKQCAQTTTDSIVFERHIKEKSTRFHMHRTGSYPIKSGIYLFVLGWCVLF